MLNISKFLVSFAVVVLGIISISVIDLFYLIDSVVIV